MRVLCPHMHAYIHAWSQHNAVLVTNFHLKIVSCTPFRQVSKAWTSILEMGRFVRRSLVTNAFLCLAFKLCDGSQSILHDHQQIVHTMDVQVFYYCNILIRRYVGEAWQPRASSCRGMHARTARWPSWPCCRRPSILVHPKVKPRRVLGTPQACWRAHAQAPSSTHRRWPPWVTHRHTETTRGQHDQPLLRLRRAMNRTHLRVTTTT